MSIRFDDRVIIITGAGGGLGRAYALSLAARGARVVVNDFGGAADGTGASSAPAEGVAKEVVARGGHAISHGADVTNPDQVSDMIAQALAKWGRVDGLVNNAGILRDVSFAKSSLDDFRKILDVHVMGSVICTKAVWPIMCERKYGRVLMTSSSSGLYGNFGQSNYAAAKMAVIGLMNVLQIEGEKYDIRVNTLAPGAATRLTEGLAPPEVAQLMQPDAVTPAALYLLCEEAPRRAIINATAGGYSRTMLHETEGVFLAPADRSPDAIAARFAEISDTSGQHLYTDGAAQVMKFVSKAAAAAGVDLGWDRTPAPKGS